MMDALTELLLTISNALLVPVILLLLLLFTVTVVYLGGVTREAAIRWRCGPAFWKLVRVLRSEPDRTVRPDEVPEAFGLPAIALREHGAAPGKLLDDLQLVSEQALGRLHLGVRLGPILGLAGTLIPLGPALVALSTGDVATLSAKLVVAFTTTVLGLLVGGACFAMHSVRRRWYMQDLNDIEFVFERLG